MPIATAVIAPNNMRKATRAIGPMSCTPILIHRKDELQIAPRRLKTIQCLVFKGTPIHEMGGNNVSMYWNLEILRNHRFFYILVTIPAGHVETANYGAISASTMGFFATNS